VQCRVERYVWHAAGCVAELIDQGVAISRKRVARLMAASAYPRREPAAPASVVTTRRDGEECARARPRAAAVQRRWT
jgi:hypothetical protein